MRYTAMTETDLFLAQHNDCYSIGQRIMGITSISARNSIIDMLLAA